jgi:hypothetical protein
MRESGSGFRIPGRFVSIPLGQVGIVNEHEFDFAIGEFKKITVKELLFGKRGVKTVCFRIQANSEPTRRALLIYINGVVEITEPAGVVRAQMLIKTQ